MSIFDQDIRINHELLIENGWEERFCYSESEHNYRYYILKVKVASLKNLKGVSTTVWFSYDPRTQMIEFLESEAVKPLKVDTISDINIYINNALNHFNNDIIFRHEFIG